MYLTKHITLMYEILKQMKKKSNENRTPNSWMKDLGGRLTCHLGIRIKLRTTIFEIQLFLLPYVITPGTFPRTYILN